MATEEASIAQCDEVTESLELLDAVLLQFDEEKQTPPPPEEAARIISSLVGSSPYQSLQRGQGTQTTLPRPSKKLSSQFGSLPFDLSAHAAPSAPPWLNKEAPRNHLHLPIQNPLTAAVGQSTDDEQFSDDSLEGQVWSSDRDLSSGRDDMVSRGEEPPKEEEETIVKSQSRSSIAWDIDWNEKKDEENDRSRKGTYVVRERKRRALLDDSIFKRPAISTSKSSDHLARSVKMSRGRSLPSLNSKKPVENGIIVPIITDDENFSAQPAILNCANFTVKNLETVSPQEKKVVDAFTDEPVKELISIVISQDNHVEEIEMKNECVECNGCSEPNPEEEISQESAIIPLVSSEVEDKKEESISNVDECAIIISTENQNGLLEAEILVNGGNCVEEELEENFEPVKKDVAQKTETVQEEIRVIENEDPEIIIEAINLSGEMINLQEELHRAAECKPEATLQDELLKAAECELETSLQVELQNAADCTPETNLQEEIQSVTERKPDISLQDELQQANEREPVSSLQDELLEAAECKTEIINQEEIQKVVECKPEATLQEELQKAELELETATVQAKEETSMEEEKAEVLEEKVDTATEMEIIDASEKLEEEQAQVQEVEPEQKIDEDNTEEITAPPLSEILDSGSDVSDEEKTEPPGPCEMSFKIMRPKVVRPNSMPPREENVVVYTTSVTLYPDAGLITYYDESKTVESPKVEAPPNLLRPKSCSDITASSSFTCVDINIDDEPLSLEPVTATEEASEAIDDDEETEELEEEIREELKERVMELPVRVECMVQTEIFGLSKKFCLESPGEQVVPSLSGFTPVEHKSLELSLLAAKKAEEKEEEEVPAIKKPSFLEPSSLNDLRRSHHGSHTEVCIPEQRRSAPDSFLFPGSYTIPLSFAVTNKPPALGGSDPDEVCFTKDTKEQMRELPELPWEARSRDFLEKALPELPWEARSREIRMKEEKFKIKEEKKVEEIEEPVWVKREDKPAPPPHSIENRPKAKTPIEPEYRSVHKNRPPPLPPHQNLGDLYSEPRSFPDSFPAPPPPPMGASFAEQRPLPPTPLTPDRPLPPSPRLPTSASFPVPAPLVKHSPNIPHRPLPSPPNTLKTRSVDAGYGKGIRDQLKAHQGCTLPPDLSGATPRRHGGPTTGRKKHRAPAVPPHASLPETPVFSRGCDIPRAPYRALGIPVLRSSLSEEGAALCGPGRGWYPKQRRPAARSTEHLEQTGWGGEGGGGGGRKPHTLPPNMSPPKFFHRSSPREALRRVTSLLIRGRAPPPDPATAAAKAKERREAAAAAGASAAASSAAVAACETPQRQKRSFFRHFWKKSKHYSLEQ